MLTSEAEPCWQAVIDILYMQVKSPVKFPTCFLSFCLQVRQELSSSDACGHIQVAELQWTTNAIQYKLATIFFFTFKIVIHNKK